jgi:ABC-type sugar transport system ATPase subunit
VARCVQSNPKLLIVAEPTRGVDIGAKDEIHRRIIALAAAGTAVVVVSSELDEVRALSHRVAVFSSGRLVDVLDKASATPERVMRLATPGSKEAARHVAI